MFSFREILSKIEVLENKIVVPDRFMKLSRIKYQKSSDKNTNFNEAENQKDYYQKLIADLVNGVKGAKPYDKGIGGATGVRVKSKDGRIDVKIQEKDGDASTISDYLGGAIEVESLKAMKNILQRIRESGHRLLEIHDMLSGADNDEGYRAVHLQVQLNNGFSAELQLLPAGIARIKEELHPIYEKYRTPEAEERAKHDIDFKAKMDETRNKLKQAYAKAFEEFKRF